MIEETMLADLTKFILIARNIHPASTFWLNPCISFPMQETVLQVLLLKDVSQAGNCGLRH